MRLLSLPASKSPTPPVRLAGLAALAILPMVLFVLPEAVAAQEQWLRLSTGLPFSDVDRYEVSADGRWVVYIHDAENDNAFEVWSVPTTGGTPRRLSALLPAFSFTNFIAITPNSQRVLYSTPQDSVGVYEAYSVPISGGPPVKLNRALAAGEEVQSLHLSADGSRALYVVDTPTIWELLSTSVVGGASTRLDTGLFEAITDIETTPDGSRVVFLASESFGPPLELYSVPITGGTLVKLNGTLVTGGDVQRVQISPDGSRVVYLADQQTLNQFELYSVPIAGGTVVKLNSALVPGGSVAIDFQISPEGDRVVYRADQDIDGVDELFSVPIGGGTPTKLHIPLGVSGRENADVSDFAIACDSDPAPCRVVFSSDQESDGIVQLYTVSINGSTEYKISEPGALISDIVLPGLTVSPDGEWVVYRGTRLIDGIFGFRADPRGAVENAELIWTSAHVPSAGPRIQIEPSGRHVVVLGFGGFIGPSDMVTRLFRFRLTGPPQTTGNEIVPLGEFVLNGSGEISNFTLTADGHIVYAGDQDTAGEIELYAAFPPFFDDGFESGDLSAWSTSTP